MAKRQDPKKKNPEMMEEKGEPVRFTCYRIDMGEETESMENMNSYSVTMIFPDGEYKHQVYCARNPEDVGESIRVPPGTRVIMTQMVGDLMWDSQAPVAGARRKAESST